MELSNTILHGGGWPGMELVYCPTCGGGLRKELILLSYM